VFIFNQGRHHNVADRFFYRRRALEGKGVNLTLVAVHAALGYKIILKDYKSFNT
jgi:hypothetical protein